VFLPTASNGVNSLTTGGLAYEEAVSLVNDLITEVVDSSSDMSQVLRKAMVLASELRSEELRAWTQAELDGYPEKNTLPDYRIFPGSNFGSFVDSSSFAQVARSTNIARVNVAAKCLNITFR